MSKTNQDASSILQISSVAQIKLFIKSTFLGYSDPLLEEQKKIREIRYKLKTDQLAKKYLSKDLTFSKQFIATLVHIHQYMKAFRDHLSFQALFDTEKFPLFILSQYSSAEQLELYNILTNPDKIKSNILKNGLFQTKLYLKQTFLDYKSSFSQKQIYKIHKILDLGTEFYSFLQYDLTDLILMLYPSFFQDPALENLEKNYKKLPLHHIAKELESFVNHLSSLKSNSDYYNFIEPYGKYLKIKIINKREFRNFFAKMSEFFANNLLLNILQVQGKNELIRALPPQLSVEKPSIVHILQDISEQVHKSHGMAICTFVKETEDNTLNFMFDKQTIQQIRYQQNKIDSFLKKNSGKKSAISISLVLMAFSEKVFYKSVLPTFEFLVKNTVFVLPEFKKDLIYYFQALLKSFQFTKDNIKRAREVIQSSYGNLTPIEIRSKQICQDFLSNAQTLDSLLDTVFTIGSEELKNKVQFVIPKDKMEKLVKNIQISRSLIQKIDQYVQISLQTSDIF